MSGISEIMRMSIEKVAVDGRVQAGALRELGIKVPDNIPDAAGTDLDKIEIVNETFEHTEDHAMMWKCEVKTDKFEWIILNYTIKPKDVKENKRGI